MNTNEYEMLRNHWAYLDIIKYNLLSEFKATSTATAHRKQILTAYKRMDNYITGDAVYNILSALFDPYSKLIITIAILSFIAIIKFQSKKPISECIWEIFRNLIQRTSLTYPRSKLLQIYFYLIFLFFYVFFNCSIKTDIVVNDSRKPINQLNDILRPEYQKLRPVWLANQKNILDSIYTDNHNDDYTKVIKKAHEMNISKSILFLSSNI